jgi:imidazoleglycerol-phosphate dehydratase/histidinol-phosphatase
MRKVLFIDRDGTILKEPEDEQVDSLEKLEFMPGVIGALSAIARETDFELVMVTNQDGLGTPAYPEENFLPPQNKMLGILAGEGVKFAEIFIDRSFESDNAPTRKPGTAMLTRYLAGGVDLASSFVIGDRLTDIELAKNLGCRAVYVSDRQNGEASLCTRDWQEIRRFLTGIPRRASVSRKTNETDISIEIDLDGTGKNIISTGIGFFDHMLEQVARHGGIDITLRASGDLHVDEHHLVEDTAIVLGQALDRALGKRRGMSRYGFALPMDDSAAEVLIDLGGRPWLEWNASFRSDRTGSLSTDMFQHFFRSLSDNAKCNIHVRATGDNDHHKAEAIFKAFARALGVAVARTGSPSLPSTKGTL